MRVLDQALLMDTLGSDSPSCSRLVMMKVAYALWSRYISRTDYLSRSPSSASSKRKILSSLRCCNESAMGHHTSRLVWGRRFKDLAPRHAGHTVHLILESRKYPDPSLWMMITPWTTRIRERRQREQVQASRRKTARRSEQGCI